MGFNIEFYPDSDQWKKKCRILIPESNLGPWLFRVNTGEHGQHEGRRLARPGLGLSYHILNRDGVSVAFSIH